MGELRFSTYNALENLKNQLWREYDHDKATLIVCIWDGERAVDAITLFKNLEESVRRKGADIRVELREMDGHDLEDQAPIVMLLPTFQLRTRVTAEETDLIVDELIADVRARIDFFPDSPDGEKSAQPDGLQAAWTRTAEQPPQKKSEPSPTLSDTLLGAYLIASKKAAKLLGRTASPVRPKAEKSQIQLSLERLRTKLLAKYDPEQPMLMICAWEGQCAVDAVTLYGAFKAALDKHHSNARVNIKKIDPAGFADQGPLVMTQPVNAVYVKVKEYDAEMIVSRTILRDEVLEGLLYHPPMAEEPKTLTLEELSAMAGTEINPPDLFAEKSAALIQDVQPHLPKSLPLLVPGTTSLRSRSALIAALQPFVRFFEADSLEALTAQAAEKSPDQRMVRVPEEHSEYPPEESELMTVSRLMGESDHPHPAAGSGVRYDPAALDTPVLAVLCAADCDPLDAERISAQLAAAIQSEASEIRLIRPGRKTAAGLGVCLLLVPSGLLYTNVRPEEIDWILERTLRQGEVLTGKFYTSPESDLKLFRESDLPFYRRQTRLLTGSDHFVEDYDLEAMLAVDGLEGLRLALSHSPVSLIREVKAANFRDRFLGGVPIGQLLDGCRKNTDPEKYIVAIANCGSDGSPVDLILLKRYFLRVVEGMQIASYAVGAKKGVLYLRNADNKLIEFINNSVEKLRERQILGSNLWDQTLSFDLELFLSDGEDIGAEITSVLAKIAGEPVLPKRQPPYPGEKGLYGHPTIVIGLQSFALLPQVFRFGSEAFAEAGSSNGGGTLLLSVQGVSGHPGIVEVSPAARLESILSGWKSLSLPGKTAIIRNGRRGGVLNMDQLNYAYEFAFPLIRDVRAADEINVSNGEFALLETVTELERTAKASCDHCATSRIGIPRLISMLARPSPSSEAVRSLAEGIRDGAACSHCRDGMITVLSLLEAVPSIFSSGTAPLLHRRSEELPAVLADGKINAEQNPTDKVRP